MTNLYDILGVPTNATPVEIKSAYRSLAQKHHPDRQGGDHALFQAVQKAYDVLGDPVRRQAYDETGSTGPISTIEDQARAALASLINEMVDAITTGKGDLAFEDPISAMRQALHKTKEENAGVVDMLKKRMEQREKAIARLKRKTGENILVEALRDGIAALSGEVAAAQKKQQLIHAILDELAEYDYEADPKPKPKEPTFQFADATLSRSEMDQVFKSFFRS